MYLEEATIDQDSINEFMEKAKDLEVKDLVRDLEADSELKNNGADEEKSEIIDLEVNDDPAVEAVSSKVDVMMPNDGIKSYSCDKCEYWSK